MSAKSTNDPDVGKQKDPDVGKQKVPDVGNQKVPDVGNKQINRPMSFFETLTRNFPAPWNTRGHDLRSEQSALKSLVQAKDSFLRMADSAAQLDPIKVPIVYSRVEPPFSSLDCVSESVDQDQSEHRRNFEASGEINRMDEHRRRQEESNLSTIALLTSHIMSSASASEANLKLTRTLAVAEQEISRLQNNIKGQKSFAAAKRAKAKEMHRIKQQERELEENAAREKVLRENIPGLGLPHWSAKSMGAMKILLSITSQADIDTVNGEIQGFIIALKNLVETGEPIVFDHHTLTDCEKVFANTINPILTPASDSALEFNIKRVQNIYWENYASGKLNLELENYRKCSMHWYLSLKTFDAFD